MLWAAAWLHKASANNSYLQYIDSNGKTLGDNEELHEFGWNNKRAGIDVLLSKVISPCSFTVLISTVLNFKAIYTCVSFYTQEYLSGNGWFLKPYQGYADSFICALFPETPYRPHVQYTPGSPNRLSFFFPGFCMFVLYILLLREDE